MCHGRRVEALTLHPIGVVRSPLLEKARAPRQPTAAEAISGRIELLPEHEHALADLDGFDRIWVIFWFDRATPGPRRVLPPRSHKKRGVFATRSPHRPNPIGLSALRLLSIEGLSLHVSDLDILDGTPVLDIKPYLPYADAFPDASTGWLDRPDPLPAWRVQPSELTAQQLAWISARDGGELNARISETLALGPQPHPYRRIHRQPDGSSILAVKDWRVRFVSSELTIVIERVMTGYRARQLAEGGSETLELHREFTSLFG